MTLKHPSVQTMRATDLAVAPIFTLETERIPRHRIPQGELPPDVAYQIIHDELMLDGNARMNLATFVTTWMEPQAEKLMAECLDKNMIDKDEYPQTAELEMRCVSALSHLWHAPDAEEATGCSTTGSSEAAMLGGLALKRRWQKEREKAGKPTGRPNVVMGINVQVCWEKLANYWDVEMRLVPMEGDRFRLSAEEAVKLCDENTIGVIAVLGSTFDGSYEPVKEICEALDDLEQRSGLDVPVHVDGASGAFVAPFVDEDLEWDFRLPRVASINASGHKYGLVYPGVGWIVWRDTDALPEDLIFWVNYLGDNMPTFALNFSRPGAQVVAQYYNFLRLGFDGYRRVQGYARAVATRLASQIGELGPFELLTSGDELPVFAFTLADGVDNYTVFDVSNALRERGWLVPAYTFPKNRTDLTALRVVVKQGFGHDMADLLVADIERQLPRLQRQSAPLHDGTGASGFHHEPPPAGGEAESRTRRKCLDRDADADSHCPRPRARHRCLQSGVRRDGDRSADDAVRPPARHRVRRWLAGRDCGDQRPVGARATRPGLQSAKDHGLARSLRGGDRRRLRRLVRLGPRLSPARAP
jgi:glutamate decarboxylase